MTNIGFQNEFLLKNKEFASKVLCFLRNEAQKNRNTSATLSNQAGFEQHAVFNKALKGLNHNYYNCYIPSKDG